MRIKSIKTYIAKNFLTKLLQIYFGFFALIFFINFLEASDQNQTGKASILTLLTIAIFKTPDFINDISPSLILMSALASFYTLSLRSEVTIIRISGFSLWQTIQPIAFTAFFVGIFWSTILNMTSIQMLKKANSLENKYFSQELRDTFSPNSGIWMKQQNSEKEDEEIILRASKVFRDNMEMEKFTAWFFDKNGVFYKKIDAKKASLKEKYWRLENLIINDSEHLNQKAEEMRIPTNLDEEFIKQKILNNFENPKIFSIFELPQLIQDLKISGLSQTKFKSQFNFLLCRPLIFLAMSLIACYFGLSHFRNQKNIMLAISGIAVGLIFYITNSIVENLGNSGLVPIFSSTWLISLIYISIGTLLIYRKEKF